MVCTSWPFAYYDNNIIYQIKVYIIIHLGSLGVAVFRDRLFLPHVSSVHFLCSIYSSVHFLCSIYIEVYISHITM